MADACVKDVDPPGPIPSAFVSRTSVTGKTTKKEEEEDDDDYEEAEEEEEDDEHIEIRSGN